MTSQSPGPTGPPKCEYCGKTEREADSPIQHVAIGGRGSLIVRHVWLHPECERGYVRLELEDG